MKKLLITLLVLASLGFGSEQRVLAADLDTLSQVSTIDALLGGLYDGVATVASLKKSGDFGIGTFDALDGEMVVLDGEVYRVNAAGVAAPARNSEMTPFAGVTFFMPDQIIDISAGTDFDAFRSLVDNAVPSLNHFYAFRLDGRFHRVRTRSVPRQNKPYQPLVEVVKNQSVFDFRDVDGTIVGFYCPAFVKGINVPGYHLHFLTKERTAGGHVMAFDIEQGTLKVDALNRFVLQLPESQDFARVNLQKNRNEDLDRVEK